MIYFFYKVRKEDIFIIKFLLESYENIMVISTIDKEMPKIQITIAPDFEKDCEEILADMQTRFHMVRIDEPSNVSQGNY